MKILALDLATKTGWAHSDGPSGVQDFKPRRGDSPGMRWIEFRAWLTRMLLLAPADMIVYEQAHHRGGAPTHVAHALIGIVEEVAAEQGIEVTNRHSATIKKHAIGKGKGGKELMVKAAKEMWPDVVIIDDNHADSLWLLSLVQEDLGETKEDDW